MCNIWESCKHAATSDCLQCEENVCEEKATGNYYEFNHWENDEEDEEE